MQLIELTELRSLFSEIVPLTDDPSAPPQQRFMSVGDRGVPVLDGTYEIRRIPGDLKLDALLGIAPGARHIDWTPEVFQDFKQGASRALLGLIESTGETVIVPMKQAGIGHGRFLAVAKQMKAARNLSTLAVYAMQTANFSPLLMNRLTGAGSLASADIGATLYAPASPLTVSGLAMAVMAAHEQELAGDTWVRAAHQFHVIAPTAPKIVIMADGTQEQSLLRHLIYAGNPVSQMRYDLQRI